MSLTGKFNLTLFGEDVRADDFASAKVPTELQIARTFASGVGLNQADLIWAKERTLLTAASEDLDVVGGLTGIFGGITPLRLKGFVIESLPTNTTILTVSRPAANGVPILAAASDAFPPLKPGGFIAIYDPSAAGILLAAGTADLITIANAAGASAVYRIGLLLASA
jgi:hypothetical protein